MQHSFQMSIGTKVPSGKFNKDGSAIMKTAEAGKVKVFYPSLVEIGIVGRAVKTDLDAEDIIQYEDQTAQWVFAAIIAAVKAKARNAHEVVEGVPVLKPGLEAVTTLEQLTAPASRTGEGMANLRDCKQGLVAHALAMGKSQAVAQKLQEGLKAPEAMAQFTEKAKALFASIILAYGETLDEAQEAKFSKFLSQWYEYCTTEEEELA